MDRRLREGASGGDPRELRPQRYTPEGLEKVKLEDGGADSLKTPRSSWRSTPATMTSRSSSIHPGGGRPTPTPCQRPATVDRERPSSSRAATGARSSRSTQISRRRKGRCGPAVAHRRAPGQPGRDRHSRQHAQGRLGRDEPVHHRPAAGGEFANPGGAVPRARSTPALRPAGGRAGGGPADDCLATTSFRKSWITPTTPTRSSGRVVIGRDIPEVGRKVVEVKSAFEQRLPVVPFRSSGVPNHPAPTKEALR